MNWRPTASVNALQERAKLFASIRQFFLQRQVLEVDTPALSTYTGTDVNLGQFKTTEDYALYTSPEFAMKRLLASGSGDIYQLSHVFRQDEVGQRHNPEFMMLEWYRCGWDEQQLMAEVIELIQSLKGGSELKPIMMSFEQAFTLAGLPNPFEASLDMLREAVLDKLNASAGNWSRDECLDALMAMVIEPMLPADEPCFIHSYPRSQAALAQFGEFNQQPIARRFELYWLGMELANGYFELTDAHEQRKRFNEDAKLRIEKQLPAAVIDETLLAALEHGMPSCSGVALGVDRLMMILGQYGSISEVLPFDFTRV
ncbi:EF-P lysine aminoacylase EpmA [Reinekea sp.]|jgi:lysyl-tRNA synthetase class 2|uniref:EF-P lysine aminoacylase EpmA n=1 Tax=Reinekea sp. TaxID=1970455 RepID=UPI00398A0087